MIPQVWEFFSKNQKVYTAKDFHLFNAKDIDLNEDGGKDCRFRQNFKSSYLWNSLCWNIEQSNFEKLMFSSI